MVDPNAALLSAQQGAECLSDPRWIFLDASLEKAIGAVPPLLEGYLPGSRRFDFETDFCDVQNPLPHTLPTAEDFQTKARALGINVDSNILVYDRRGVYASPRAWWMFKIMGHENVWVLNGGLPAWLHAGLPVVNRYLVNPAPGNFVSQLRTQRVIEKAELASELAKSHVRVIDARSRGRFNGTEPEPRSGLRSGHMPGADNLPFAEVCSATHFCEKAELQKIAQQLHIAPNETMVFTCGSGVTACIDMLAFYELGYRNLALYDGSWSEWGADSTLPIICG
jgi:thiosulfate/3-mercaptopyruvate sulfurtransferase